MWWNTSTRAFYCATCARQINAYNPGLCVLRERDARQRMILEWAADTFGTIALNKIERVLRFIEEAVELAQANDLPVDKLHAVVDYVYAKPKGEVAKEAGAVGTTLLALCALHGVSADDVERDEAERIVKMDPAYFRERHNKKAQGGIAAFTDKKEEG